MIKTIEHKGNLYPTFQCDGNGVNSKPYYLEKAVRFVYE